jgi:hypothetical protein
MTITNTITPLATAIQLSPLMDPDGVPMQGMAGEPLAADEQGVVYTLRDDGPPDVLGELTPTDDGRLILVPLNGLNGLGAHDAHDKDMQKQLARCRRALARSRRRHWQRRVNNLSQRINSGNDRLSANNLNRLQNEHRHATDKLAQAKTREAEAALTAAQALSGDGNVGEINGLGASWWTKNRDKIVGFGAGAASAALVASGASKGTGLNTLINQGWNATKGFLLPPSQRSAAPAALPSTAQNTIAPRMPVTNQNEQPVQMPIVQAGIDTKTMLLISGLGLGALVLLRSKR